MKNETVTLLCSAAGLGFYIPGLIVERQMQKKNIKTDVLVFEELISKDIKYRIFDTRKVFRDNFKVAVAGTRIPKDIRETIDFEQAKVLLEKWLKEKRKHFISLSGHWVYILDMYREMVSPDKIFVDLLYVDSDLSPSWKSLKKFHPDYAEHYNEIWLYNSDSKRIYCQISVTDQNPLPYGERLDRFLIHGGGWGIGTYKSIVPELTDKGIALDIAAYEMEETLYKVKGCRYFINDPSWFCWNKNKQGCHEFPPFSQITAGEIPCFKKCREYHGLFDVSRGAKGIISKPGAGTIMDSLASATPLIMLEPFGKHEQKNSDLWEYLGFGIKYEQWKASGFSRDILVPMHNRLLEARNSHRDYTEDYIQNNL